MQCAQRSAETQHQREQPLDNVGLTVAPTCPYGLDPLGLRAVRLGKTEPQTLNTLNPPQTNLALLQVVQMWKAHPFRAR